MKTFFPLLVIGLLLHSFRIPASYNSFHVHFHADTTIHHVLDGKTNEWPLQKFETDVRTEMRYAVDNDPQYLYLALVIPNSRTQIRIMRQGMELFLDAKGKKKESKGIEFPVKEDASREDNFNNFRGRQSESGNTQENSEERKANMRAMRAAMAINLVAMKVFGFSNNGSEEQGLQVEGSANIAFAWDSTDAMNIEYKIPITLLGSGGALQQKELSVGVKLNGIQMRPNNSNVETGAAGSEAGFGGRGGRRNGGGGSYGSGNTATRQDFQNMLNDQIFWTKYVMK